LPVKAYAAIGSKTGSALHQIHAGCGQHIEHRKTCPNHGEVANDQIVKAYSYAPGDDLKLTAKDLSSLSSADDENIRVDHLAAAAYVDLALLSGRSLWLVPTHAPAASDYALVVECLSRAGNRWPFMLSMGN
jgi:non-homologous end joining protein Ku